MKLILILNAASPDYLEQCAMLAGLLEQSKGLPEPEAWIVCREEGLPTDWIDAVPAARIVLMKTAEGNAETVLAALEKRLPKDALVLFPENYFGSGLAARLAYRMSGSAQCAVQRLHYHSDQLIVQRSVYSGHMMGRFRINRMPCCLTAARSLEGDSPDQPRHVVETVQCETMEQQTVIPTVYQEEPPAAGLKSASFVLAVGRGIKNQREMENIRQFAEEIGAELGCSRPVVMSALAPMEQLIGVSGTMTRPDCCIALGVSGAPAFYAGIERSKLLISVNQDEAASIHRKSDASIVGDLWEFIEELRKQLSESQ